MPQIIVDSINRSDLDMRKELFQSIVLSGGTTLTKGEIMSMLHHVHNADDAVQALVIECCTILKGLRGMIPKSKS